MVNILLESVYTSKGYQGFESPSFRKKINELQLLQKCCGSFFFVKYAYVFLLKIERKNVQKDCTYLTGKATIDAWSKILSVIIHVIIHAFEIQIYGCQSNNTIHYCNQ